MTKLSAGFTAKKLGTIISTATNSPCSPASDANRLKHVNAKLTDVHKEEDEEAEGTVTPEEKRRKAGYFRAGTEYTSSYQFTGL